MRHRWQSTWLTNRLYGSLLVAGGNGNDEDVKINRAFFRGLSGLALVASYGFAFVVLKTKSNP